MDVRVGLWKKLSAEELMLFELWCWRRLLRVPWTGRRSNQSILKEISPGIYLEGKMLKLKLQSFGHLMRRVGSLEKTLMLGGTGGSRKRGRQEMRWLDGITDSMDMSLGELREWWWTGRPGMLQLVGSQRVGHDWATELNWTEAFFMVQPSHPYMTTGKTIALTQWIFVSKVMSLLFNMLSRLVMTFFPRSSVQFSSVTQSCSTLCDPINHSTPGFFVHNQLPESTQTQVH